MRSLSIRFIQVIFILTSFFLVNGATAQVVISTKGASASTPDPNVVLQLEGNGTTQGLIIPTITNIATAPNKAGMVAYSTGKVYYNDGSQWTAVGGGSGSSSSLKISIQGNLVKLDDGSIPLSSFPLSSPAPISSDKGSLFVWDGTRWSITPKPTATGQILKWDNSTGVWVLGTDVSGGAAALPNNQIFVGNASSIATPVPMSGDAGIDNTGKVTLSNTTVIPNTYGSATSVPQITINAQGRITNAVNTAITSVLPAAGGDISGTLVSATVTGLQGRAVFNQAPNNNDVLKWNNANLRWEPQPDATGSGALPTLTNNQLISFATGTNVAVNVGGDLDLAVSGTTGAFSIKNQPATGVNIINSINSNTNPSVLVSGSQVDPDFTSRNISTTGKLTTGTAGAFAVDPAGNIIKINGLTTSFPTAQSANTFLRNDGAGNLTWSPTGGGFSTNNAIPKGNGTTLVASSITDDGTTTEIGAVSPTLRLRSTSGVSTSAASSLEFVNALNGLVGSISDTGSSDHLQISSFSQGLLFNTNFNTRMAIDNNGNVGIGTTGPISKLDVSGDLRLAPITAPGVTAEKLYNVGGSLFWNGTNISTGGSGWSFIGNSSRVDGVPGVGTNYIGTTDNVPLNFMVNSQRSGRIDPAQFSTFFGFSSGQNNGNVSNTGFGNFALAQNTSGAGNTAVGASALSGTTTGIDNTAVGNGALFFNSIGNSNAAFGNAALSNSSNASGNTAMGNASLQFTTTGQSNTALGQSTGITNTTGSNNIFLGSGADVTSNSLSKATAIGYNAKVGASNSLVLGGTGVDAVNVGIGVTSPVSKLDVSGDLHLAQVTAPAPVADKLYNVGGSLFWNGTNISAGGSGLINNTGTNNLFAGASVSTGGTDNAIYGANAGSANTGNFNVILGANAATSKTSGDLNTIVGWFAGKVASNAGNTLVGAQAGENLTGGPNTFIGEKSGRNTTTGTLNVYIGNSAALTNTTGDKSTIIGYGADVGSAALGNANAIGYKAYVTASNSMVLGGINGVNGATANTNVGIGTTAPTATLDVNGTVALTSSTAKLTTANTGTGNNMLPIAYFTCTGSTSTINTKTSNVTAIIRNAAGNYEFTITGENFSTITNYIVVVTLLGSGGGQARATFGTTTSSNLGILTYNASGATLTDNSYSVVVYKP